MNKRYPVWIKGNMDYRGRFKTITTDQIVEELYPIEDSDIEWIIIQIEDNLYWLDEEEYDDCIKIDSNMFSSKVTFDFDTSEEKYEFIEDMKDSLKGYKEMLEEILDE